MSIAREILNDLRGLSQLLEEVENAVSETSDLLSSMEYGLGNIETIVEDFTTENHINDMSEEISIAKQKMYDIEEACFDLSDKLGTIEEKASELTKE